MSSDHCGGKTLGSLFLLISFLQKWLRLRLVRMCVIAQTPLIRPFGSIGFREREREVGGERRRRRGYRRGRQDKEETLSPSTKKNKKNKMWNLS